MHLVVSSASIFSKLFGFEPKSAKGELRGLFNHGSEVQSAQTCKQTEANTVSRDENCAKAQKKGSAQANKYVHHRVRTIERYWTFPSHNGYTLRDTFLIFLGCCLCLQIILLRGSQNCYQPSISSLGIWTKMWCLQLQLCSTVVKHTQRSKLVGKQADWLVFQDFDARLSKVGVNGIHSAPRLLVLIVCSSALSQGSLRFQAWQGGMCPGVIAFYHQPPPWPLLRSAPGQTIMLRQNLGVMGDAGDAFQPCPYHCSHVLWKLRAGNPVTMHELPTH